MGSFSTAARTTLSNHANPLLAILFDAINQARRVGDKALKAADYRAAASCQQVAGVLALRGVELSIGKRLKVDMRVSSQDDLPNWKALPAEARAKLEQVLDEVRELSEPIPAVARALPLAMEGTHDR